MRTLSNLSLIPPTAVEMTTHILAPEVLVVGPAHPAACMLLKLACMQGSSSSRNI